MLGWFFETSGTQCAQQVKKNYTNSTLLKLYLFHCGMTISWFYLYELVYIYVRIAC